MNHRLIAAVLVLLLPTLAGAQRLGPGEAPRGAPTRAQPLSTDPSPGPAPSTARENGPGGAPSGPRPGEPAPTPSPSRPSTARPGTSPPSPSQDADGAMRFTLVREGPADICGKTCHTWVSASGRITPDTARDFLAFAKGKELRGVVVVLDSNGGTVTSGLELGRAFRRFEMTTTVGKTTLLPGNDSDQRATLSPRGVCASMCAFAFLGGVRRHVPPEGGVLVHQIWPSAKREDAAAQTYTAENLVALQRSLGQLARFIIDMGADIEIFDLAMRIPPWERMRAFTADEMKRLRVRTVDNPFDTSPTATGPVTTVPAPPTSSTAALTPPTTTAWTVGERDGLRGLLRSHPLTMEGDDIGSFEIMLTCGDTPDAYALRYSEKRRKSDAGDTLAKVLLLSGKDRVTMTVESSGKSDADLASVARGAMPLALLNAFAESGDHSIVLATETAKDVRTLIRIGNTGLGAALPQLSCQRKD